MSYSNKSPTNGDPNTYNASYGKSKWLFFSAPGRDKTFQNEYIYLSFYSYEGISLGLKVLFWEEDKEAEMWWKRLREAEEIDEDSLFNIPDDEGP